MEGAGKNGQKTRASQPTSKRTTPGVKIAKPCMNTTKNPPPVDQGLAFQTHALQMILLGHFHVRTRHRYTVTVRLESCPYNKYNITLYNLIIKKYREFVTCVYIVKKNK